MKYPATRALIPLLNRWLGNKTAGSTAVANIQGEDPAKPFSKDSKENAMQKGMIVEIKPANGQGTSVLGTVSGPDLPLCLSARGRKANGQSKANGQLPSNMRFTNLPK